MRLAEQLETAIEQGTPTSALDPALEGLEQRLMDFIALGSPWIMEMDEAHPESGPVTSDWMSDLDPQRFTELHTALSENNSRARRLFNELEPALKGRLGLAACQRLRAAIHELRFGEALTLLQERLPQPPAAG